MSALPVEKTEYGKAHFRLELRPLPSSVRDTFSEMERKLAESGVTARWISIVDPWGSPVYSSQIIPSPYPDAQNHEEIIHKWVDTIHSYGLPVVSWYPLIFSESGWQLHPEWRQISLLPWPDGKTREISCCVNSGYAEALIELICEAIGKFNLDGIWFDGSAFTEIWERPLPLTCFCEACREKFKRDTGLDLPQRFDWNDPIFRRWVAWRFEVFSSYIGKLAKEIRKRYPNVAIVVNHYHRPQIPWHSAIPLDLYPADIITGSEATGIDAVDLVMRLCRAYNRKQSEVWRPLDIGENPPESPQTNDLLHHALACYIAGGIPSYGYPGGDMQKAYETISLISPIMRSIHPYVGGNSLPYLAIHVSQQSETFYFGRAIEGKGWKMEPFFTLLNRWTKELMSLHIPPDYIYDKALTKEQLSRYKVLLMPFSPALSEEQVKAVLDFVKKGGILYLGPGCGERDEWGEPRRSNPLGDKVGFKFEAIYPPSISELTPLTLVSPKGETFSLLFSLYAPFRIKGKEWKILYRFKEKKTPAIASRKYGKGFIILSSFDLSVLHPWQAVDGLDTKILPSTSQPAQGKRCAQFVDGPKAPYSFCPDMEIPHFPSISTPLYQGGRFSFYIKLEGAEAQVELRNSQGTAGILLHFSEDGNLAINGKELLLVPLNQWLKVDISFAFKGASSRGECKLSLALPTGQSRKWEGIPLPENWGNFDWAVIFGPGTKEGRFWIDDVEIVGLRSDGKEELLFKEDFEGYNGKSSSPDLSSLLWEEIRQLAPPPIEIEGEKDIRFGVFEKDGAILIHLHNPGGTWRDFGKTSGKELKLLLRFPVAKASLPLKDEEALRVKKRGDIYEIVVPSPCLYEIIRIRRL